MYRGMLFLMCCLFVLAFGVGNANAATNNNWNAASGNWTDSATWSQHRVPISSDSARIGTTANASIVLNTSVASPASVTVGYANNSAITGTMRVTDGASMTDCPALYVPGWNCNGKLVVSGGSLSFAALSMPYGASYTGTGEIDVNNAGSLIITGTASIPKSATSTAIIKLSGNGVLRIGTPDIGTTGTWTFDIRDNAKVVASGDKTGTFATLIDQTKPYHITAYATAPGVSNPHASFSNVYDGTTYTTLSVTLGDVNQAYNPMPASGTSFDKYNGAPTVLTWNAGNSVAATNGHQVYFGTSFADVNNATTSTSGIYKGAVTSLSWTIDSFTLGKTYYWRVDEVDAVTGLPHKGQVWSFNIYNYTSVDDFESYADGTALDIVWSGGSPSPSLDINNPTPPAHSGTKDMRINYSTSQFEVQRQYGSDQDWTKDGIQALQISVAGDNNNAPDPVYLKLKDGNGATSAKVVLDGNGVKTRFFGPLWTIHNVAMSSFTGIDLTKVTTIIIGAGNGTAASGSGEFHIDDIRLYVPFASTTNCVDLVGGDCTITYDDLAAFSAKWLTADYNVVSTTPAHDPVLWYKFDDAAGGPSTCTNSAHYNGDANNYDGTVMTNALASATGWNISGGVDSNCINFDGNTLVDVPVAVYKNYINRAITISMWIQGTWTQRPVSYLYPSAQVMWNAAKPGTYYSTFLQGPSETGAVTVMSGDGTHGIATDSAVWTVAQPSDVWGQWNHLAFTIDCDANMMCIYHNGTLVAKTTAMKYPNGFGASLATQCRIGVAIYPRYNYVGKMDDFRMYNYALSQAEIANLAGTPAGNTFVNQIDAFTSAPSPDFNGDGKVNFDDFAAIASHWLIQQLWP